MTPAEKANNLRYQIERTMVDADMFGHYDRAIRQCALIAVDEMINMCKLYHNHNIVVDGKIYTELTIEYWEQVKQEIEIL